MEHSSFLTLQSEFCIDFNHRCPEEIYDMILDLARRIEKESELSREEIGKILSPITDWF